MSLEELIDALDKLHEIMDGTIDGVTEASRKAQDLIYKAILKAINKFETADGAFVRTQNYAARLARLQKELEAILGEVYTPAVSEYLGTYSTVGEINISLQKSYNEIEVETALLTAARKAVMDQAQYYLVDGLATAYIQPAKYLIMQQVATGITLKDAEKVIRKWNDGEALPGTRQTPNLQKYATQVSRDSLYGYYGAINEIIAQEYELSAFIYTGDIIEDSRPMCRHLVGRRRTIELSEMDKLIKQFPQGLYPNTTEKNFIQLRGGYSCRHGAFVVK